jgi:hypothetical protein
MNCIAEFRQVFLLTQPSLKRKAWRIDAMKWLSVGLLAGAVIVNSVPVIEGAPLTLQGFVCDVSWNAPEINDAGGRFGFLSGSVYTKPFCAGSFIGFFALHSIGQTQDPNNHSFTDQQLTEFMQILQRQMLAGQQVELFSIDTHALFRGISSVRVLNVLPRSDP